MVSRLVGAYGDGREVIPEKDLTTIHIVIVTLNQKHPDKFSTTLLHTIRPS